MFACGAQQEISMARSIAPGNLPTDKGFAARFEVQSYIGSEIAELREDGERPPRSAKMVVELDLGSGPGGGDYRTYLLSTNRERSLWILWSRAYEDKPLYCRIATGRPYRGYPARFAAEQLLIKSWQDERDLEGLLPDCARVLREGLLNKQDIHRIKMAVLG
jgi:hypothetical protein